MLNFTKMNGAGNDFVVIDNRQLEHNLTTEEIAMLCDRHRGIGADGLLAVEPAEMEADYKFRYYNSDGREAEMCGNGARCFGAYTARLSSPKNSLVTFETVAGTLSAEMIGSDVRIIMSEPYDLEIDAPVAIEGLNKVHSINTGVPHAVSFIDDLASVNVLKKGAAIRFHNHFSPNGTNANFVSIIANNHIKIRTYERGVENETLACGTGMCAAALLHHILHNAPSPVMVDVAGGDTLEIGFIPSGDNKFSEVTLTGPADFVYSGQTDLV